MNHRFRSHDRCPSTRRIPVMVEYERIELSCWVLPVAGVNAQSNHLYPRKEGGPLATHPGFNYVSLSLAHPHSIPGQSLVRPEFQFGCRDRNRTCLTWLMRPPSSPELRTLHHYGGPGETRTLTPITGACLPFHHQPWNTFLLTSER